LRWQAGQIVGIQHSDPVKLNQLVGYEFQREVLVNNTEFLLAGYPALHVLLYGSRGSGKSSLVKAL
jgi:predicted AAA+ superfamily ATPase